MGNSSTRESIASAPRAGTYEQIDKRGKICGGMDCAYQPENAEVDWPHSGSESEARGVETGHARGFIYAPPPKS